MRHLVHGHDVRRDVGVASALSRVIPHRRLTGQHRAKEVHVPGELQGEEPVPGQQHLRYVIQSAVMPSVSRVPSTRFVRQLTGTKEGKKGPLTLLFSRMKNL